MIFRDRAQAGIELAGKLRRYKGTPGVVLAAPRGGVPVGYAVARELGLPMQLLLTKKIGHPKNRECTIGAVGLRESYLLPYAGVGSPYIEQETAQIRKILQSIQIKFDLPDEALSLCGKTVFLVDDGIATGNTLLCAVNLLRKREPAAIVLAAPVASPAAEATLRRAVDDLVVVETPERFSNVSEYYLDFHQLTDEEVLEYLQRLRTEPLQVI